MLCSMSLIPPILMLSIIFSQFWLGAFSQNCWKKPCRYASCICFLYELLMDDEPCHCHCFYAREFDAKLPLCHKRQVSSFRGLYAIHHTSFSFCFDHCLSGNMFILSIKHSNKQRPDNNNKYCPSSQE